MAAHGIDLVRLPIPDVDVPPDRDRARAVVQEIVARLARGEKVVIACRGGLGRTGMIAACTLVDMGASPVQAVAAVRRARHGAIQTREQEKYVLDW
jgi:protein-tyrosine phosphatase